MLKIVFTLKIRLFYIKLHSIHNSVHTKLPEVERHIGYISRNKFIKK